MKKVIAFTNTNPTTEETLLEIGNFFPYLTYEMDVEYANDQFYGPNAIMEFSDATNRVIVSTKYLKSGAGNIKVSVFQNGSCLSEQFLYSSTIFPPYTIRVQWTGKKLHVFSIKNNQTTYHGYYDVGSILYDTRNVNLIKDYKFKVGARMGQNEKVYISRAEALLTCGTGQADPKPITYKDGQPIIVDNKLWLTMTTRGFDQTTDSYQGVYSLDINTLKWNLEGAILFDKGDGILRQYHSTHVVFDRDEGKWLLFTTSFGDNHIIYKGESNKDVRKGITIVNITALNYVSTRGDEDVFVIYDESVNKWRLSHNSVVNSTYITKVYESDSWNGTYTKIAESTNGSETGSIIQKIGGTRYVIVGKDMDLRVYSYPDLNFVGNLTLDNMPGGYRLWGTVVPVPDGKNTRYLLITFDRGKIHGNYSYGALYIYEADEKNDGYEYDLKYLNI